MKHDGLIEKLRKTSLFRFISDEAIQRLLDCSHFVQCEPGDRIIEEGTMDDRVYVILEKSVAVMVRQGDEEVYIATIGAGQVVGEAAIFAKFPRTASVVANDTTVLLQFERATFIRALRSDPEAGMRVLFVMIHSLLSKLREVNMELAFERRLQSSQDDVDRMVDELMSGVDPLGE